MNYLIDKGKKSIFALKSNRFVALSEADWQQGQQRPMSELEWEETTLYRVWLAGVQNALVLARQTFLNKDGSRGELYLIANDLGRCAVATSAAHLQDKYALRWKVRGRPCGGVLQIDQVKHGLRAFTRLPGENAKQPFIFVDAGPPVRWPL